MKTLLIIFGLVSQSVFAHEGHHEQKHSGVGKFGGVMTPVTHPEDVWKGTKSEIDTVELVRSADGTVRLYLYSIDKKKSDVKKLAPKAMASIVIKIKGQDKATSFDVALADGVYIGKMPKPSKKPFDLVVTFKQDDKPITAEFHDLD